MFELFFVKRKIKIILIN